MFQLFLTVKLRYACVSDYRRAHPVRRESQLAPSLLVGRKMSAARGLGVSLYMFHLHFLDVPLFPLPILQCLNLRAW